MGGHFNHYLKFKGTVMGVDGSKFEWYVKNPACASRWRRWYTGLFLHGAPEGRRWASLVTDERDEVLMYASPILTALRAMKNGHLDLLEVSSSSVARDTREDTYARYGTEHVSARALPLDIESLTDRTNGMDDLHVYADSCLGMLAEMRKRNPDEPPKALKFVLKTSHFLADGRENVSHRRSSVACAFFRPSQWLAVKAALEAICEGAILDAEEIRA